MIPKQDFKMNPNSWGQKCDSPRQKKFAKLTSISFTMYPN